jgi:flagellar assembly factor FliW
MSSVELVARRAPADDARGTRTGGLPSPAVLTLPEGLVGLPDAQRFRVEPLDGGPLLTLDALDELPLSFVAAPLELVDAAALARLDERGVIPPGGRVLVLLSVHGDPPVLTANLAGPILIEADGATARQVVLEDPAFPLRAPLSVAD